MLPIASDAGSQSNDIAAVRLRCLRARGNEGSPATYFQHFERPLRYISADGVEHRVAVSHHLREIHRIVVDDLVGTDLAEIIMVRRACGGDHASAEMFRQLYGKPRDTARASLDQNLLARFEFSACLRWCKSP